MIEPARICASTASVSQSGFSRARRQCRGAADLLQFARSTDLDLLIVRCPVEAVAAAQALERSGAFLTDTLVYYRGPTSGFVLSAAPSPSVRLCQEADRESLQATARASFAGFFGHYHADPRLDPIAATEGYVEWASSALADAASVVLVSETDDVCRASSRRESSTRKTWEIVLNGVRPNSNAGASTRPCSARSDAARVCKAPARCWFPPSSRTWRPRKSGPAPASCSTMRSTPSTGGRREWLVKTVRKPAIRRLTKSLCPGLGR